MARKILVIRHGALGDIIYTLGAFKAIRDHHQKDHITLLTSAPYKKLCEATGYFDEFHIDNRESFLNISTWVKLRHWFRAQNFDRIYDLQTSKRTSWYFKLWGPNMPEWSGIAPGCSHPQELQNRKKVHIFERFADQLKGAGIDPVPWPTADWYQGNVSHLKLPKKYCLLIPGCSPNAPHKRWPVEKYANLGKYFQEQDITPVVIGTNIEATINQQLEHLVPGLINLTGKTSMLDLFALAKGATLIVGNDTGPTHMAAIAHKPTIMLFSGSHDPLRIAPPFPTTKWLLKNPLENLEVQDVIDVAEALLISSSHRAAAL